MSFDLINEHSSELRELKKALIYCQIMQLIIKVSLKIDVFCRNEFRDDLWCEGGHCGEIDYVLY